MSSTVFGPINTLALETQKVINNLFFLPSPASMDITHRRHSSTLFPLAHHKQAK